MIARNRQDVPADCRLGLEQDHRPVRAPLDELKVKNFSNEVLKLLGREGNWKVLMNEVLRSNNCIEELLAVAEEDLKKKTKEVKIQSEDSGFSNRGIISKIVELFRTSMEKIGQEERRIEFEKLRSAQIQTGKASSLAREFKNSKSQVTKAISKKKRTDINTARKSRSKLTLNPKAFHRKITKIMDRILKW